MRHLLLVIILFITTADLSACSCGRGPGRNFLANINNFDIIALGRIMPATSSFTREFIVEKVYKGSQNYESLKIANESMCDNYLTYDDGTFVILGLSKDSKYPSRLSTYGCITTSILVKDDYASTIQHQFPLFGKPRIGIIKRKMKLRNLERRIARKVWWNGLWH